MATSMHRNGAWLDTLAAAHAECGDFDTAVQLEIEAYEQSRRNNTSFLQRVGIYREGLSYTAWRERERR